MTNIEKKKKPCSGCAEGLVSQAQLSSALRYERDMRAAELGEKLGEMARAVVVYAAVAVAIGLALRAALRSVPA